MSRRMFAVAAFALGACQRSGGATPSEKPSATASAAAAAPSASARHSPLSQKELPTTDASIAVSNLVGQVELGERRLAEHPKDAPTLRTLIGDLSARGQYLGTVADYFRASDLSERLVEVAPKDVKSFMARASTRGTLHRFDDALADLAHAAELGAKPDAVDDANATILLATGHFDDALAIRHRLAEKDPNLFSLAGEATVLAAMGRTEPADRRFTEAEYAYRDVSPFPIAWLWFQQGLLWENAGSPRRARDLFRASVERLPVYAPAVSHLAALAAPRDAIGLLTPIVERTDDPEYPGQLSVLVRAAGDTERADELLARAKKGYVELESRAPLAFADHAARFWLGPGQDPARALRLAQANARARPTPQSKALLDEALALVHAAGPDR